MTDDDDVARANAGRSPDHTLYLVDGKGYDWDVDIELIDGWLKSIDDDTYDQVVAALRILASVGTAAGGLDRGLAVQEHEGVATRVVGA